MQLEDKRQKRVLSIQDISCVGRCSLTVALPIISAAGIETSIMPTAVLSTHTGGFTGFTYRDLTEDLLPIVNHWKTLDIHFDAIYTAFLGSLPQIEIVKEVISKIKKTDTLIVVDPAMADDGKLYSIFPPNFPEGMRKLVEIADVIVPNMTEASMLLGEDYKKGPYTKEYIEGILGKLSVLGPKTVVLTGVYFNEEKLGTACFEVQTGEINYAMQRKIEGSFHGTGDVFASSLVAAVESGLTIQKACEVATGFVVGAIERTLAAKTDIRFGVNFEAGLGELARELNLKSTLV